MAKKAVIDAVEAHILSSWTGCPVLPANTMGEAPADGSDFVVVQYPVANNERFAINEPYYREEGAVRFVIHTSRGAGIAGPTQIAEELAALFRDRKLAGVEFKTPSSPVIRDDNDDGNYFRASVVVPYTFNYRGA